METDRSRIARFVPAAIVLAAAVTPYLGVLHAPFVFDDVKLVKENRFLRQAYEDPSWIIGTFDLTDRRWDEEELRPNYRPLRFLSYLGDYALSRWWYGEFPDASPPAFFFHATNVLLHALNSLLVLAIARRLARRLWPAGEEGPFGANGFLALTAGLLFALHPLQTEAVTYISGRRDVLSTFFFLAAAAMYLGEAPARGPGAATIIAVPFLLVAGLLTKEMAATLPAVLLLLDIALGSRWTWRRAAVHALCWCILAGWLIYLVATPGLVAGSGDRDLVLVLLDACRYAARYMALAVFPVSQSIDYSHGAIPESTGLASPWTTLPSAILILAAASAGVRAVFIRPRAGAGPARRSAPLAGIAILWFLGTLVPVLQIVPIAERFAERFAYLPLAGGVLLGGLFLAGVRRWEPILGWGLAGLLAVAALAASVSRNRDWRTPLDLWTSAVEAQPRAARAHFGRATALKEAGRLREAAEELTTALSIFEERPDVPLHQGFILQALTIRGGVHGLLAKEDAALLESAVADYRRVLASRDVDGTVIESSPRHAAVHFDLGGFLLQLKRFDEARSEYRRVIEVGAPASLAAAAEYYAGKSLLLEGNAQAAIDAMKRAFEKIPELDPSRARVAIEIAELLLERKDLGGASEVLRRALDGAQGADRLHLLYREAKVLDRRGDLPGCLEILARILGEDPAYVPALVTWAKINAQEGKLDQAEERYRRVLAVSPVNEEALAGLRDLSIRRGLKEGPPDPAAAGGASTAETERLLGAIEERGKKHFEKGKLFAARDVFVELLSRAKSASSKPHQLAALRELALVADRLGLAKESAAFLEQALEIDSRDAAALRQLGDIHLRRLEDREGARRHYERYLDALPAGEKGDPKVYYNLASLVASSNPSLAIRYAKLARDGGMESGLADRMLGYLHADAGAWQDSLDAFNRYLETPPAADEAEREAARAFVKSKVLPRLLETP